MAHVNGQTFLPGDSILFKRGDVWNESLVPPSSGSSGNPITFDAYGTGAPPNLTGYYRCAAGGVGTRDWECMEGAGAGDLYDDQLLSVWINLGTEGDGGDSNLTAQWDFYLASGYVYVYSVGNLRRPTITKPIVPMALSNVPVINVNGTRG